MSKVLVRAAMALGLALLLSGCVSFTRPAAGHESLAAKKAEVEGPSGYLALTATFDMKSFTSYPSVEIDLTDEKGGKTTLKVGAEDLVAFPKAQETVPLLFTVPVGGYRVTRTVMNLPGGSRNGRQYEPSEHVLTIEKELTPFKIEENRVTHLAVIKFTVTESVSPKYLYYYSQTTVDPSKPDAKVWALFKDFLVKTPGTYLKKTSLKTFTWPEWHITSGAVDSKDDGAEIKGSKMSAPSVIQKVTQSKRAEIGACHLHYSPKATGKVEISYVIQPDGHVKEAKLTKSTLEAPKTEGCILGIVKKLKFPKTPSDDFETWSLTWEFNAAK